MELTGMEFVNFLSHRIVFILLTTAVRGTVLIGVVYLFLAIAKRMTSKTRHIIWFLTILSFIILPVLSKLLEPVQIGILPPPFETSGYHHTIFLQSAIETGRIEEVRTAVTTVSQMNGKFFGLHIGFAFTILTICWIIGLVIFSSRFIYGFRRIRKILKSGTALCSKKYSILEEQQRNIRVYSNADIAVPFTFGIFHPVVIVPKQMASWSAHRLKPILIHELIHIRRKDYLTQTLSKIICCFFWPLPFTWLALRNQRLEQEKACDEAVVLHGSNPRIYAQQLLNMARSITGGVLFTGLFMVNERTRMLEKRIKNILKKRGTKMEKRHWFFVVLAYVIILSLLAGCGADGDSTVSQRSAEKEMARESSGKNEDKEMKKIDTAEGEVLSNFFGTYVNREAKGYNDNNKFRKFIVKPSETGQAYHAAVEVYFQVEHTLPTGYGGIELKECWKDQKGNWYCQLDMYFLDDPPVAALWRLNQDKKTLELNWTTHNKHYQTEIIEHDDIPKLINYAVVYRSDS